MSILTQYREKLHLKEVEKGISQHKQKSSGQFTGLETVVVLLDASNENITTEVLSYVSILRKIAGTIKVLGYVDVKEISKEMPFDSFCKKELDWLWRPKSEITELFKQYQFDLLINLCQTDCFPLEYLAVAIDANYKIGALTNYPNNYNLMLDSKNLGNYLEQVNFFLNKFRNT